MLSALSARSVLGVASQLGHCQRYTLRCAPALLNRLLWNVLHDFHGLLLNLRHWDLGDLINALDQRDVWVRAKRKADLSVLGDGIVVEIEILTVVYWSCWISTIFCTF